MLWFVSKLGIVHIWLGACERGIIAGFYGTTTLVLELEYCLSTLATKMIKALKCKMLGTELAMHTIGESLLRLLTITYTLTTRR